MKKTLLYTLVAITVLSVIAALIITQIVNKKEIVPSPSLTEEQQSIEAEGPLQQEGRDLNAIEIDDADVEEIDTELETL
jgi:hypothetical protein